MGASVKSAAAAAGNGNTKKDTIASSPGMSGWQNGRGCRVNVSPTQPWRRGQQGCDFSLPTPRPFSSPPPCKVHRTAPHQQLRCWKPFQLLPLIKHLGKCAVKSRCISRHVAQFTCASMLYKTAFNVVGGTRWLPTILPPGGGEGGKAGTSRSDLPLWNLSTAKHHNKKE